MPSSSRLRDRATACASMPLSFRKTSTPIPPSTRPYHDAAGALPRPHQPVTNMPDHQPHTIRQTREYSAPTLRESSVPFDRCVSEACERLELASWYRQREAEITAFPEILLNQVMHRYGHAVALPGQGRATAVKRAVSTSV